MNSGEDRVYIVATETKLSALRMESELDAGPRLHEAPPYP